MGRNSRSSAVVADAVAAMSRGAAGLGGLQATQGGGGANAGSHIGLVHLVEEGGHGHLAGLDEFADGGVADGAAVVAEVVEPRFQITALTGGVVDEGGEVGQRHGVGGAFGADVGEAHEHGLSPVSDPLFLVDDEGLDPRFAALIAEGPKRLGGIGPREHVGGARQGLDGRSDVVVEGVTAVEDFGEGAGDEGAVVAAQAAGAHDLAQGGHGVAGLQGPQDEGGAGHRGVVDAPDGSGDDVGQDKSQGGDGPLLGGDESGFASVAFGAQGAGQAERGGAQRGVHGAASSPSWRSASNRPPAFPGMRTTAVFRA